MEQMNEKDISAFLKNTIEPLENDSFGKGYRASVQLVDGLFLPCVVFRNPNDTVELAARRFKEEQSGHGIFRNIANGYKEVVKSFVTKGNRINVYDIASVEESKFAFPTSVMKQIRGETTMSWTGFAAKMKDGKYLGFGTRFSFEFFHMPDNYSVNDIVEIINHSYVLKNGELHSHEIAFNKHPDNYKDAVVFRERPFFECFIDNL